MKIQLLAKELQPALQTVINVVEKKHNLPILSHILISLNEGILTLTTSDLEIQIKTNKKIQCQESITFTIYAKNLIDIVKDLDPEAIINMDIIDNKIKIKINKNKFELNSLNHKEFPTLEQSTQYNVILTETIALKKLLEKTSFTIKNQDIRIYLNGLYIDANHNELTVVSSDGYRLSLGTINQLNPNLEKETAIIPKKCISEIAKLLIGAKKDEQISLNLSKTHIQINFKDTFINSQLINSKFPNYQKSLSNEMKGTVLINRIDFINTLKSITPLTDENNKSVELILEGDNLRINMKSERGRATANIKVNTELKKLSVIFNIYYLISAADKLTTENIKISTPKTGGHILTNETDNDYQYIIMPIKL